MGSDNNPQQPSSRKQTLRTDFFSGMFSGAVCSLLFNPWDRAVFLSVKHNRSFLRWDNFSKPYHGALQALVQRTFMGSGYYVAQAQIRNVLTPYLHHQFQASDPVLHIMTGLAAGTTHGVMTNTSAVIKAYTWGHETRTFSSSVVEIYKAAGLRAFGKGMSASILRDAVHGSTYELCRHFFRKTAEEIQPGAFGHPHAVRFGCDTVAALTGTIVSSPLNHARTLKFATLPQHKPPTIPEALAMVWKESHAHVYKPLGRLRFFQSRFCIGIGTMRAAAGMALGQQIFDFVRNRIAMKTQ